MRDVNSFCYQKIGCDPEVLAHHMLVMAPIIPERTSGGIIRPEQTKATEKRSQHLGLILKIGPSCFVEKAQDKVCQVGDWIHYTPYERVEVTPNDFLCYYMNDERIISRIDEEDLPAFIK